MPILAALRLFGSGALAFAKRLNFWQIALVVAVGFALFWRTELAIERRHSAKVEARVNELSAIVDSMTRAKNEQATRTKGNIDKAKQGNRDADRIAKGIEAAPVEGCKTPSAVLQADI